jgi:hypothetical protein
MVVLVVDSSAGQFFDWGEKSKFWKVMVGDIFIRIVVQEQISKYGSEPSHVKKLFDLNDKGFPHNQ